MTNEPIFNVATLDHRKKLATAQAAIETRLLPAAGITIAKVLSYSADVNAAVSDVFTGEARYGGRVTFRVLFLDGNGQTHNLESAAEFSDKILSDALEGGRPDILSRVLDTDIVSVSADEIKLAAVIETDLLDNETLRFKYLSTAGEDVFTREDKVEVNKLSASAAGGLSLEAEVKVDADRILLAESKGVIQKVDAGNGFIAVKGEVVTNILTDKGGELFSYRAVTAFAHEISAEGCESSHFASASVAVKRSAAALLTDGEDSAVGLEFELEFSSAAYGTEEITLAADAFSVKNELEITASNITVVKNKNMRAVTERIEGAVTLSEQMPAADKILASVSERLNISNSYIQDEKLVLEGTVTASIIYFSAETEGKNSVDVELPFSIVTMESMTGTVIAAYGHVYELSAKLRKANEIDIRAEITVSVLESETAVIRAITQLEVGEESVVPGSAISLHIARKDESLWDIAKAMRTTPELILLQNPALTLPLSGGERVLVYRHLKRV